MTIALTQAPTSAITVAIGSASTATADPATVTLDATNWSTGVTTTVTAIGSGNRDVLTLDGGGAMPSQLVAIFAD